MGIKGNGVEVRVNPARQSNGRLISAAQENADTVHEGGLELPFATGVVAVEGAMQAPETTVVAEAPTPPTKESLAEQLTSASKGYKAVIDTLNNGRIKKDVLAVATDETVAAEFEAWFSEDKLAYVATTQESDPNVRFTLIATPNTLVTYKDLTKSAKAFGQNQPYETHVWDSLYSRYAPKQLSGTDPSNGNSVIFSLIPNAHTPGMEGTVVEQRTKLNKLQVDNPDLKVPSPLEAVTHWQTLRAQGEQLADNTTFNRTDIRHFNLPEQRFVGGSYVPGSCVYSDGEPDLNRSGVQYGRGGRVSVG